MGKGGFGYVLHPNPGAEDRPAGLTDSWEYGHGYYPDTCLERPGGAPGAA